MLDCDPLSLMKTINVSYSKAVSLAALIYRRSFMFNLVSLYEYCYPNRDLNNRSDSFLTKSGNDLTGDYFGLGYNYP